MSIESIAGPIIGGLFSSDAASSAASTQAAATDRATQAQAQALAKQQELQEPFRQAGLKANSSLLDMLGLSGNTSVPGYGSLNRSFGASDFQADPGYQWRLSQGQKALDAQQAAKGMYFSGASLKAANDYAQNQASQEYGNAYQRWAADNTNKYNRLAGLVNSGMGATNNVANAAGNYGNNLASLYSGLGNAQGAAQIAGGNAWGNAFNQISNNYNQQNMLNKVLNRNSGGSNFYGGQDPADYWINAAG